MSFFKASAARLVLAFSFFLLVTNARAQTTLVPGDIAFTGYFGNGVSGLQDKFSFVLLAPISATTTIKFTDNGWLSTNVFRTGEGIVTFTASSPLPAGTEILITITGAATATATLVGGGSAGTCSGTTMPSLSANGDQILAYQGAEASPTFISAIHMNVYDVAVGDPSTTTTAAWDGTANTAFASALPPGLTNGVNALWIPGALTAEKDNAMFSCSLAGPLTTALQVRTACNNVANWLTNDDDPSVGPPSLALPTGCSYIAAVPAPSFTTQPSAAAVCVPNGSSFTIVATGASSYQWQVDNGGGFTNITNNATYAGATTPTLTISGTTLAMNGYQYRCVATNGSGSTNSNPATLTVNPLPANPTLLAKTPSAGTVADGTPVSATFNAGSGGTGCSDDYRYTTDGGATYLPYTPGSNISTTGLAAGSGMVFIEGRRANCSAGCQGSYTVLASWVVSPLPAGATTLNAGDIAFSGYIGGAPTGSDGFSFVLLRNIGPGTVINFTNNGWLSTNVFRTGEETVTWTAASALSAGTEIFITGLSATRSGGGPAGTVTGTALNLSLNGDQVLAYRGTAASPTFISAIHMNVYSVANGDPVTTTAAAWDGTANTQNASALPTGLTTGVNCIWIGTQDVIGSEFDNSRYGNCANPAVPGAIAALRASLNNQANWTSTNGDPAGFSLPTGCNYLSILCPIITVTNPATATGPVNTPFSQTFTATGGSNPYTFTTLSTLPAGITLSTGGVLSGTPTEAGTFPITVTATDGNGCSGTSTVYNLVISCPAPVLGTATPSSQTVCSGTAITTIVLAGAPTGAVYNWTRDNNAAVTGIAASGSGDISGTLTNTTNAPVTVTFTITPVSYGTCNNTTYTATVTVNPTPNVVATPSSQSICSGASITTIVNSGSVTGTSFDWTRDNTGTVTGISASGSGKFPECAQITN